MIGQLYELKQGRFCNGEDYLEEIKREIKYIKPFEEDDLEWYDQGLELLEKKRCAKAEKKFKELIISQPEHFDGYEGLARAYKDLGEKAKN